MWLVIDAREMTVSIEPLRVGHECMVCDVIDSYMCLFLHPQCFKSKYLLIIRISGSLGSNSTEQVYVH